MQQLDFLIWEKIMNNNNLINPYLPREQQAFYRWIAWSKCTIGIFLLLLLSISLKQWYEIHCIKKEFQSMQKKIDVSAVQQYEHLHTQHQLIKDQREILKRWKQSSCYYEPIKQLSEKIPDQVKLSELELEDQTVVLKGEAISIEYILSFIHNLNTNALFKEMNLIELQPSANIYQEKNLVYFIIKGKLQ